MFSTGQRLWNAGFGGDSTGDADHVFIAQGPFTT